MMAQVLFFDIFLEKDPHLNSVQFWPVSHLFDPILDWEILLGQFGQTST